MAAARGRVELHKVLWLLHHGGVGAYRAIFAKLGRIK